MNAEAHPLAAADQYVQTGQDVLEQLGALLQEARRELGHDERVLVARELRKLAADACTSVAWILLDRLGAVDKDVLQALRRLEPAPGAVFRTTMNEIHAHCDCSFSIISVALRRLSSLGLIERRVGGGNAGTWIKVRPSA